jgi:hypothetical protein
MKRAVTSKLRCDGKKKKIAQRKGIRIYIKKDDYKKR